MSLKLLICKGKAINFAFRRIDFKDQPCDIRVVSKDFEKLKNSDDSNKNQWQSARKICRQ